MMDKAEGPKHEVKPEGIAEEVEEWRPRIHLEVSKEQLEMLEIGKTVKFDILGKVKALHEMGPGGENARYEICLELQEVGIKEVDNEFTKMAEEEEE